MKPRPSSALVTLPPRRPLRAAGWILAGLAAIAALGSGSLAADPVPRCDDETFLRRASLDLIGRPPSPAEIEAFLADPRTGKRDAAIDRLLDDPDWSRNWARYFRDVILFRRTDDRAVLMAKPLEDYLAARLRNGSSWATVAREFVTAVGVPSEHGETAIILAQMGDTADIAAEVSRIFLGVQIQCAQCHDHFTDRWKRRQFHEFAAFFPRIAIRPAAGQGIDRFEVASFDADPRRPKGKKPDNPRRGDLEHVMPDLDDPAAPGTVMTPSFFLGAGGVPLGTSDLARRQAVAAAITADANPWFARAVVNRLWTDLVGDGFYSGIDDIGPDREVRDAARLDALATSFVASGHDLRRLFREILATDAYQRESRSRAGPDRAVGSANCPQRLRADQLFTQVLATLGVEEAPSDATAKERRQPGRPRLPRMAFAQVFGYDPSLPREEIVGSIPQVLLLMNSKPLSVAIDGNRRFTVLGRLLQEHADDRVVADELYLRTLARHPTPDELAACLDHVASAGARTAGFEDVFWALINSAEFVHRK